MTASVIHRWPLYAGQRYSKYMARLSGSCSVTVIYRVTRVYRAIIYRFDLYCGIKDTKLRKKINNNSVN